MPRGNPHGYLESKPYKPDSQHHGEDAGGSGTFGTLNNGQDYAVPYDPTGEFGKSVNGGAASAEARRLIAESTGMQVEAPTPESAFPKPVPLK